MRVLDIRYRHRGVADSVIDDRIHRYRHRVLGQNLHVRTSLQVVCDAPRRNHALLAEELLLLLHPINDIFSRIAWVNRHQKGKPSWILLQQEMMGWQWHQLDHMQITFAPSSRQITTPVPQHSVFTGRMPSLPPNRQRQSTEEKSINSY